ncbi:SDR family NAD(P)-dependent oxidoreductase [Microbacterium telephonicum]|uniref:3-oxoacyl-[acyl-carrier protein] reductase n=1 Tax=Microbacterium telephonicum TaxID=1714841 RepID=A0A498C2S4_9MICO|nr:SDR family oxidoreductase [Microbacterium telephonicum]RLK47500.1 3-oxoacyl-[acyl-carrier protein] reductase [Microbacterium telephonicum]
MPATPVTAATAHLLDGRVVLVTGAGRGAGVGIARRLADHGASVAVNYAASREGADALVAEIRAAGGTAAAFGADVRDPASVAAMVDDIERTLGRLDAVVNNAIAGDQQKDFDEATLAHYDRMYDFAVRAVVTTTQAALPAFERAGGGRIVNVVSELWNSSPAGWSPYTAAKGAMVGLSRSLSAELAPRGVTVNMVAPGWMIADAADEASEGSRSYTRELPLGQRPHPEDIGDVIAFYLSELAAGVTGAYLLVNGGKYTQTGV